MTDVRAADLPEGSVIGYNCLAVIRISPGRTLNKPWASTHTVLYDDNEVDQFLDDGAKVLRHGYGD